MEFGKPIKPSIESPKYKKRRMKEKTQIAN